MQHISPDSILLVLEDERSSSSKIREMFNNCGIYQINTLSEKNKDLKSWVNNLSEYNLEWLYEEMERF
jgi:catechol-2,3-dioxygenase